MRLTVIIATRGRPELLLETVRHAALNMANPSTRLLICADDDDMPTLDALKRLPADDRITYSIKPREDSRGEKYNRALKEAKADIYLPAVDYAPILTPGFDRAIINAARIWEDGIGVVFSPMIDELIPGLQAITARFVEKMGYIYSPRYAFWFIDHEIADIAAMIGRINFVDIDVATTERPGKTTRMRDLVFWTHYFDLETGYRRKKAREIIDSVDFDCPQWLKAQMRNWYPLTEMRSLYRNARVRHQAAQIEAERGDKRPPDAGYVRIKAAADQALFQAYHDQQAIKRGEESKGKPLLSVRHNQDAWGVTKDWLWPTADYWGWEAPLMEWPRIKALLSHCSQRNVIVQAGACCGMYPALLAKEFEHVYAFEPDPTNFECLTTNCPETNIFKVHAALGDRVGRVDIHHVWAQNCGAHTVQDGTEIPLIRIDDLNLEVCDAIMLDAEEHETRILNGAIETIRRCRPELIVVETISDEMISLLSAEGYGLAPQAAHDRHFLRREAAAQAA